MGEFCRRKSVNYRQTDKLFHVDIYIDNKKAAAFLNSGFLFAIYQKNGNSSYLYQIYALLSLPSLHF